MKKLLVGITAISLVLALIVPAMADLNVDFSGEYRIRGFYNDNPRLVDDGDENSAAWLDHRFRLKTVFQANENVSVTTRMDIFDDQPFGNELNLIDRDGNDDANDLEVDAVYLTALTPIGLFKAGRMPGGSTWGTDLGNTGEDFSFDRIEYFIKAGDIIGGVIYEKLYEDNTLNDALNSTDDQSDCDTYYLVGKYTQEDLETGLGFRFQNVDKLSDLASAIPELGAALAINDGFFGTTLVSTLGGLYSRVRNYALAPYVKADFGPVGIEAEIIYETGEYKVNHLGKLVPFADDRDIDTLTYKLEGVFDMDTATAHLGWASCTGEDPSDLNKPDGDMTVGNVIYRGLGNDFEPLLILTNDAGGKPLNNGYTTMLTGVDLLYAGGSFVISDALTLHGAIGQAWIQEDDWCGGEDDLGWEVDLGLTWQVMDNLTYCATAGYLNKGDEILKGDAIDPLASDGDDTYAVYHEVKVEF